MERSVSSVKNLVRDGYFSIETAESAFGVILDKSTLEIDEKATASCRRNKRLGQSSSIWLPVGPGEGLFWKTRFREGDELVQETTPTALQLGLSPEAR